MTTDNDLKVLARLRREDVLSNLRDGRIFRSQRIESKKKYKRKHKYNNIG